MLAGKKPPLASEWACAWDVFIWVPGRVLEEIIPFLLPPLHLPFGGQHSVIMKWTRHSYCYLEENVNSGSLSGKYFLNGVFLYQLRMGTCFYTREKWWNKGYWFSSLGFFFNLFSSLICLKTPWPGSSLGSSSCAGAASGASEEDKLVQQRSPVSSFSGTELLLDWLTPLSSCLNEAPSHSYRHSWFCLNGVYPLLSVSVSTMSAQTAFSFLDDFTFD